MGPQSIWIQQVNGYKPYPKLSGGKTADVAIIGGGVCGVTTAKRLSDQGLKVILLEADKIAESNTGRSTGNLYSLVDIPFKDLQSKYDLKIVKDLLKFREESLNYIENNIFQFNIECSFKRVPWIRYSATPETDENVQEDYEIAKELGLSPEWLDGDHERMKPFRGRCGFLIKHQAQFNPYQYVQGLASVIQNNVDIFEMSRVEEIIEEENGFILKTSEGLVRAKQIIEATHAPIGFSPLQIVLGPYREYGVAGVAQKEFSEGIHWGYYEKDKVTSIRSYEKNNQKFIMLIGEPHKVGQGNSLDAMEKLIKRGKELSLFNEVTYKWGGQHYRPADFLPYIGKGSSANQYVATGFSTDGLIYGTLAAMILTESIQGKTHPAAELFQSHRITPIKSAKKFIKENLNVLKQYASDYLGKNPMQDIQEGEGAVVNHAGHKYAISRNEEGVLHICSAVCPHMGCVVHWNNAEHSWDCPCHGSRFTDKGDVIEGPALSALDKLEEDKKERPINLLGGNPTLREDLSP